MWFSGRHELDQRSAKSESGNGGIQISDCIWRLAEIAKCAAALLLRAAAFGRQPRSNREEENVARKEKDVA